MNYNKRLCSYRQMKPPWSVPLLQDNLNINEAANLLIKHIMASESDILKTVVPDTISPQFDSRRQTSCSACFK